MGDAILRYRDLMTDSILLQPTMTLPSPALAKLFSQVLAGELPISDLVKAIQSLETDSQPEPINTSPPESSSGEGPDFSVNSETNPDESVSITPGANIDIGRLTRCGFGEVIYGEGKKVELLGRIAESQLKAGQKVLITRLDSEAAERLKQQFPNCQPNPEARTLRISRDECSKVRPLNSDESANQIHVAVVTAGSTDRFVAEEVSETLEWMGIPQTRFEDIGVAGPQRLTNALPELRKASVIVIAAGMEGALPAVVGGHLSVPIFAIPTSVGYGANFGGLSALLSMLNTCASSVAVVNIDSGFKGGYLAGMVASQLINLQKTLEEKRLEENR